MQSLKTALFLLIIFISNLVWANGAIFDGCALKKTGNIVFIKKSDIKIEKETIDIKMVGGAFHFNVKYLFSNKLKKSESVSYAFPVIYEIGTGLMESSDLPIKDSFFIKDKIRNFSLKKDGILQKQIEQKEKIAYSYVEEDKKPEKIERFYMFSLTFEPEKKVEIEVSYEVDPWWIETIYDSLVISEITLKEIEYSLLPAAYFGEGTADEFEINIDMRELFKYGGAIKTFYPYSGLFTFEKEGILKLKKKNFSFEKEDEILISYNDTPKYVWQQMIKDRLKDKMIKSIKASSTLGEKYKAENLFDGNPETAWCEGSKGNGEDEWIEFETQVPVRYIAIVNGYAKNNRSFEENGKIEILELSIKSDKNSTIQKNITSEKIDFIKQNKNSQKEFYSIDYQRFNMKKNPYYDYTIIYNQEGDAYVYKELGKGKWKIKLKINKVTSGTKYKDTCISEIFVLQ